jgi:hypothetical protein
MVSGASRVVGEVGEVSEVSKTVSVESRTSRSYGISSRPLVRPLIAAAAATPTA